jgi:hypothetical protein
MKEDKWRWAGGGTYEKVARAVDRFGTITQGSRVGALARSRKANKSDVQNCEGKRTRDQNSCSFRLVVPA